MSQGLSTLRRTTANLKDDKFRIIRPAALKALLQPGGVLDGLEYDDSTSAPPKSVLQANDEVRDPEDYFFTYDLLTGSWVLLHSSVNARFSTAPPEVAAVAETPLALRDIVVFCYFTRAWHVADPPQPFAPPQLYYLPAERVIEMYDDLPAALELYAYKSSTPNAPAWIMRTDIHTAVYMYRGQLCSFDRVRCTWQSETSDPLYQTLLSGQRGVKARLADSAGVGVELLAMLLTTLFKDLATGTGASLEQVLAAAASVANTIAKATTSDRLSDPPNPPPKMLTDMYSLDSTEATEATVPSNGPASSGTDVGV